MRSSRLGTGRGVHVAAGALLALALLARGGEAAPPSARPLAGVGLAEAWPGAVFHEPVAVRAAPGEPGHLYVVELAGRVQRAPHPDQGGGTPGAWLDLTRKVHFQQQGGLFDVAFHPKFAENRRVFVSYLAGSPFKLVLSELRASADRCDPSSEKVLLEVPKSTPQHQAGGLAFGPDGKLYLSTGDDKVQARAVDTSQSPGSLQGKILRLDVDQVPAGRTYGIPSDNPWPSGGAGVRPEIWAYGFRNPFRFSFDAQGALWAGEPGGNEDVTREWIVRVERGGNHGWPFFEGTKPAEPIPPEKAGGRYVRPFFEYETRDPDRGALIGGHVYRGSQVPALRGRYVCVDHLLGTVYAVPVGAPALEKVGDVHQPAGMGEDAAGELYVCQFTTPGARGPSGKVWRLVQR